MIKYAVVRLCRNNSNQVLRLLIIQVAAVTEESEIPLFPFIVSRFFHAVLTAGHTDDIAVSADPHYGWGWLINRGFNIIQTDWPLALSNYLGR